MALTIIGILFVLGVAFSMSESQLLGSAFIAILGYLSLEAGFYVNAVTNIGLLAPLSVWGYLNWRKRTGQEQQKRLHAFSGCFYRSAKLVFLLNSLIGFHYWRKRVT